MSKQCQPVIDKRSGLYKCINCGWSSPVPLRSPFVRTCRSSHDREAPKKHRWLRDEDFISAIRKLTAMLPDVSGVAGVPRSGLAVAAHLSTSLSVPLYEITQANGVRPCGHGRRLVGQSKLDGPLLVVEDSVNTGGSIDRVRNRAPRGSIFAALFVNPPQKKKVDYYAELHPMGHFFSWHFPGSSLVSQSAFDLDGVICHDCPAADDDDGPRYTKWMKNVKPLLLPRPHEVGAIITARLEKYRAETETWLKDRRISYKRLIMGPWDSLAERREKYDAGRFKGAPFKNSNLEYFLESCPIQAKRIHEYSKKTVICPTTGEMFMAEQTREKKTRAVDESAFPCIHRGAKIGKLDCGCSGKPNVYRCLAGRGMVTVHASPFRRRIVLTESGEIPFKDRLNTCLMCKEREE